MAALATGLALVAPAGVSPGAATPDGRWCVVVRDRDAGQVVDSVALESSREFAVTYRHSYYGEPATERLKVDDDGLIVAERVESPSLAVLDYYELTGASARRTATGWAIDVPSPSPQVELTVLASVRGRRTLVAGSSAIPLWHAEGRTRAVRIAAGQCP